MSNVTYWNASVSVDGRCVVSLGASTLSETLSRAFSDCVYYQSVYPSSAVVVCDIREQCSCCHNSGKVTIGTRTRKSVKCPECKGKGAAGALPDVRFAMPDCANRIILRQADSDDEWQQEKARIRRAVDSEQSAESVAGPWKTAGNLVA
jgi:hypothetical protein